MTVSAVAAASSSLRVMISSFFMAAPFDISFISSAQDECTRPPQCGQSPRRPDDSLFRRFAVEVLVVCLRIGAGMVDNTITMIRGRIEGIELHWNTSCIDDVVICPTRDEHGESRADHRANSIENGLASPFLHAKELIGYVRFHPDLLLGLQRHDNELTVP